MVAKQWKSMKKALIPGIVIMALALALSGCNRSPANLEGGGKEEGNNSIGSSTLEFDGIISKINLDKVAATLNITPEASSAITYTIDESLRDKLDINVIDGVLTITSKTAVTVGNEEIVIFDIGAGALEEITVDGAANINSTGTFSTDAFKLNINGMGSATFALDAHSVSVSVDGLGNINLTGNTDNLDILINGESAVEALGLIAQDASVDVNGTATVKVKAEKTLDVSVLGTGDIEYWGDPELTTYADGDVSFTKGE